jgi:ADP-ribosyl-[dinitrogen reductase] hydrolase
MSAWITQPASGLRNEPVRREDMSFAGWEPTDGTGVATQVPDNRGERRRVLASADLESRAVVAYVSLAMGDALGATVEFMTPREIVAAYGTHDRIRGGGWLRLRPGQVTDDTTMSLALGQAILAAGQIDALSIAQAFDGWMRAKPVDIGNTVRRGLIYFRHTGIPQVPPNEQDAGNGAAMRVLPVALATLGQPEEAVRTACQVQAHVTHHSALSDAATECLALMVQDLLQGANKAEVQRTRVASLIDHYPQFEYRQRRRENPTGYVVETLQAVFQAFFSNDSWRDSLVDVVNRGGDADTTGAITGMLAGALYGLDGLPRGWRSELEQECRQACKAQAQALVELAFQPCRPA